MARENRHAPFNLLHIKSKLKGFDKLGAWSTHVNFQPSNKRQLLQGLVVYRLNRTPW
jgi:hypothetical protein